MQNVGPSACSTLQSVSAVLHDCPQPSSGDWRHSKTMGASMADFDSAKPQHDQSMF
jgi:hypothetical protein